MICMILLISKYQRFIGVREAKKKMWKKMIQMSLPLNDSVPGWLESFYNSDYEYRKSTFVLENDIEDTIAVL